MNKDFEDIRRNIQHLLTDVEPSDSQACQAFEKEQEPELNLVALWYRVEDDAYKVAKPRFNLFSRDSDALFVDVTEDSNHTTRYLARQQAAIAAAYEKAYQAATAAADAEWRGVVEKLVGAANKVQYQAAETDCVAAKLKDDYDTETR